MDGREFDDRRIKASHAPDERYYKALDGQWV
jgi:hypothetical protein